MSDNVVDNGAKGSTGAYTSLLVGLPLDTKIFVRAFATNELGTSFGDEVTFFTLSQNIKPGLFGKQFVFVDWDDDGDFSDAESDITADVLEVPLISYGKNRELEQASTSSLYLTVRNDDHKYSPPIRRKLAAVLAAGLSN